MAETRISSELSNYESFLDLPSSLFPLTSRYNSVYSGLGTFAKQMGTIRA